MRRMWWSIPVVGVLALVPALQGGTTRYVTSRDVLVGYRAKGSVTGADLWVTTDNGRAWQHAAAATAGTHALHYRAAEDGAYGFYVVLRNDVGTSAPPPAPGQAPTINVVVDTTHPLVQLHDIAIERSATGRVVGLFDASLVEENLSDTGVRIFYRASRGSWRDGGVALRSEHGLTWHPPAEVPARAEVRIVVTDQAGNRATSATRAIRIPRDQPAAQAEPDAMTKPETAPGGGTIMVADVEPVRPVAPVAADEQHTKRTVTKREQTPLPELDEQDDLSRLRQLAAQFMQQGRYSLAAARLQDALNLSPQDTDLLVDLGSALYRLGRYDDARAHFQSAVRVVPEHTGALEGLALVAATEKRYADARQHLQQLLQLLPESGKQWLRYGDIEHRMGNRQQALDAWRRAVDLAGPSDDMRTRAQRRLDYFGNAPPAGNAQARRD